MVGAADSRDKNFSEVVDDLPMPSRAGARARSHGPPQKRSNNLPPEAASPFASVLRVFQEFDTDKSGVIDRRVVEYLLLSLEAKAFDKTSVNMLLTSFAGESAKRIPYTQFLEWCSRGERAIQDASTISLVVRSPGDARVEALRVSCYDSGRQVKRSIVDHCHRALACDCAPFEFQALKLRRRGRDRIGEAQLGDYDLVPRDHGEAAAGDWEVELELLRPPPLSMLDLACILAGSEAIDAALALAFCGRSIAEPLADSGVSSTGEGAQSWPPLVSLASIRAPHERLKAAARWLLARGAGESADDVVAAANECLLHCNAAVLRELRSADAFEPLTWQQVLQGLFSASDGLGRAAIDDASSHGEGAEATLLGPRAREALAARLAAEVAEAHGVLDFVELLRKELLPGVALPHHLLSLPAVLGAGASGKELIIGEAGSLGASLLLEAAHRGHCWAFAELSQRGVAWEASAGAKAKPAGLSANWLKSAAAALEDHFRASLGAKELRIAVLCGQFAVASNLAASAADSSGAHAPWSEGPLVTAARCGAGQGVVDALLRCPNADPNLGRYEYLGKGAFSLMSPLGWLASNASAFRHGPGGDLPRAVDALVARLVSHPYTDLEFGRVSGEGARSRCHLETLAHCLRRAGLWAALLRLLREGAAPGAPALKDPRLHACGGAWGEIDRPADPRRAGAGPAAWLDSLEEELEKRDHRILTTRSGQAPARLLEWLRQVRKTDFAFPALHLFPAPFRKAARVMLRHFVQRSGARRPAVSLRVLERVLSFVGFWEFPTGRPCYTRELHLRRIDGYSRTCGFAGCPVYEWELLFSACQLRLGDWAEDMYRARCASAADQKPSP